jgi:hypothetical protein
MPKDDERPKSAWELAQERLRAKDAEEGRPPPRSLTDGQKEAIAEVRRQYEARVAERKIMHASDLGKAVEKGEPEGLEQLEQELQRDLAAFAEERDREIRKIRGPDEEETSP